MYNDRLAVLCGAGLSMAPPSNLPSAAEIAQNAKRTYDAVYGVTRDPLPAAIGEQAEFFFGRGELGTVYLRTLIDKNTFAGPPNLGHQALADLLLVGSIQTAVSTNVDTMIETAGQLLFGQIGVGIDRDAVATLLPTVSPLLKVHGCWTLDPSNTVWAPGQLATEPVKTRVTSSADWLKIRLLDRDLVIVGYFTDWDYLNGVLEQTLGEVRPARVLVVDPSDGSSLETKAPSLYTLGKRASSAFEHVQMSGADFLDRLRLEFSRAFARRVMWGGVRAFEASKMSAVDPAWAEPVTPDSMTAWQIRRDLEGCRPNRPATAKAPADEPTLGLTILQLRARGATPEGPYWLIDGRRVRIIRTPNQLLHQVEEAYARERPSVVAPDVTIAVGAEASSLPPHIVRGSGRGTIVRSSVGRWMTRAEAVAEFNL